MSQTSRNQKLSLFPLLMITITSVVGLCNITLLGIERGYVIYYIIFGALTFMLPVVLVSTELASIWAEKGDLYLWVKRAFGPRVAFLAAWFKWVQSIVLYPVLLSFLAGTLAYIVAPHNAANKYYIFAMILVFLWSSTYMSYQGIKVSTYFTIYCGAVGVVLPLLCLTGFALVWYFKIPHGHFQWFQREPLQMLFNPHALVGLCVIYLCFSGIEIATGCLGQSVRRQSVLPKVLASAFVIIAIMFLVGGLAVAPTVSYGKTHLVTGVMQAFEYYLKSLHLVWLTPAFALFVVLGVLGSLANWSLAGAKSLFHAARDGALPPLLQRENKHNAPSFLLLLQAVIGTIAAGVFLYMPNTSGAFWLLSLLAVQMYMIVYLFLFAVAVRLRYKYPSRETGFKIPGGVKGVWWVAGIGSASCVLVIVLSFFLPFDVTVKHMFLYEGTIVIGCLLLVIPGLTIFAMRKKSWKFYADVKELSRY